MQIDKKTQVKPKVFFMIDLVVLILLYLNNSLNKYCWSKFKKKNQQCHVLKNGGSINNLTISVKGSR